MISYTVHDLGRLVERLKAYYGAQTVLLQPWFSMNDPSEDKGFIVFRRYPDGKWGPMTSYTHEDIKRALAHMATP